VKYRRSLSLPALAALLFAVALPVAAQPKGAPKPVPVDAKTAYDLAKAAASKWQSDAELFGFGNLVTGPVDTEGRSTAWNLKWSSKSAGKMNMMSVNNGVLTTFEMDGAGGRGIPVKPETTWDSKKLIQMADGAGGAAHRAKGAKVTLGLVASAVKPGTTLWHVSYSGDDYKELFHVAIEGETMALKVLSD
jgi:hypothetical protein